LIDRGRVGLKPAEQRRTEIKADGGIIADDIEDFPLFVYDTGIGIGTVAFEGDPFVPIMKGVSALLGLNGLKPGVFPRRLIEMTMDCDKNVFDLFNGLSLSIFSETIWRRRSAS
jgi:hypothetical protein